MPWNGGTVGSSSDWSHASRSMPQYPLLDAWRDDPDGSYRTRGSRSIPVLNHGSPPVRCPARAATTHTNSPHALPHDTTTRLIAGSIQLLGARARTAPPPSNVTPKATHIPTHALHAGVSTSTAPTPSTHKHTLLTWQLQVSHRRVLAADPQRRCRGAGGPGGCATQGLGEGALGWDCPLPARHTCQPQHAALRSPPAPWPPAPGHHSPSAAAAPPHPTRQP